MECNSYGQVWFSTSQQVNLTLKLNSFKMRFVLLFLGFFFKWGQVFLKTKGSVTTCWTFSAVGIEYSHGLLCKKKALGLKGIGDGTILFSLIALLPVRFATHHVCTFNTHIWVCLYSFSSSVFCALLSIYSIWGLQSQRQSAGIFFSCIIQRLLFYFCFYNLWEKDHWELTSPLTG